MIIYTDQDFKMFLIEDIGIFEWKEFNTNISKKKNKSIPKEDIDNNSVYNRLVTEANNKNKTVSQLLFEDARNRVQDDVLYSNPINLDELNLNKLSVSKLFTMIQNLKNIRGSAMSELMKEIEVGTEGSLLVISSTNKTLITLFINKIATWGIFPINQMVVNESDNKMLYKYYYDSDAEDDDMNFFNDDL